MTVIGVSIAVPDPQGRALQEYRVGLGDEVARHIPTHITLVPPLLVEPEEMEPVVALITKVAASFRPCRVHLRGTGTFRPVSPVVFLNVVNGIAGCEQLADTLRTGPLAVETRFPFHPHVTIAHHLDDEVLDRAFAEMADYETVFEVSRIWLYEHDPLTGWVPTRDFPLGEPG